jgi:hypothetical protein
MMSEDASRRNPAGSVRRRVDRDNGYRGNTNLVRSRLTLLRLRCWNSITCSSVPKIEYPRRVEVARRWRARPTVEPQTGKGSHIYFRG